MEIINNPFEVVIQAVKDLYPETKAIIQFDPKIKHRRILGITFGECGHTFFPDDGSTPTIAINANIPFKYTPEILAHELAHVVAGIDHKHDGIWESVFQEIKVKYDELFKKKFED